LRSISEDSGESVMGDHPDFDHLRRDCPQHDAIIVAKRPLTKHNRPGYAAAQLLSARRPQCASAC
jgi:hypothetical protein